MIVFIVIVGTIYFIWQQSKSSEDLKPRTIKIQEEEIIKIEPIEDNELIMNAIRRELDVSVDSCISSILRENDDFILVNIRWFCAETGGGTRALLKKEGDQYRFIAMLYEEPNCALMDEYSVPKLFYEACYDSQEKLR
jgi:CRISPR/Cas system-associated protein Csx1